MIKNSTESFNKLITMIENEKKFYYYFDLFPEIMVRDHGICDHDHRKQTAI